MASQAKNVQDFTDNDEGWETLVEPYAPTYKFETVGQFLTGTFVGKRVVDLEDKSTGETREVNAYEIVADSDGTKYTVWGSHNIDAAMESVTEGQTVRITWHGKDSLDGGRTVNKFTVQVKK